MSQPSASTPQSLYDLLGGESEATQKIREIVEAFYDVMDSDEKAKTIRQMHPEDLTSSREKLFMFLTGWTGGPQLYTDRYGHPFLRRRHLPFKIGEEERDQWIYCMTKGMLNLKMDEIKIKALLNALYPIADFMRNQ
ncbi:COG2346 Truncated hemoglobins [Candidatus Methylopumilus planktonicus]|jgi:hemoglobin|uniref:group II truncated hemoglobin n=1 Tax=Candidatus Methylopumilus planktonicus TaxID=1581557 RepID=UPI003BEF4727